MENILEKEFTNKHTGECVTFITSIILEENMDEYDDYTTLDVYDASDQKKYKGIVEGVLIRKNCGLLAAMPLVTFMSNYQPRSRKSPYLTDEFFATLHKDLFWKTFNKKKDKDVKQQ
jgi:hypothetical protein